MKLTIIIDCDNAAFDDGNRGREAARILRVYADMIEDRAGLPRGPISLQDFNGNKVGEAKATGK
jgi:hypothetical protein